MPLPDPFWNMQRPQLGLIRRTCQRFGWRIVFQGLIVSTAICMLMYDKRLAFEGTAMIRFSPSALRKEKSSDFPSELAKFLESQRQLIMSSAVLTTALADPKLAALPSFIGVQDREAALRKKVSMHGRPNSYVIQIVAEGESSFEANTLVRAVTESYLVAAEKALRKATTEQIDHLEKEIKQLRADLKKAKNQEQIHITEDKLRATELPLVDLQFQAHVKLPLLSIISMSRGGTRSANRKPSFYIAVTIAVFVLIFSLSMWRERSLGVAGLLRPNRLETVTST